MRHALTLALTLALLTAPLASAATYSLVDAKQLPVRYINDPNSHRNEEITDYSFEELDTFMQSSANFLRWNNGRNVCDSMYLMFGRVSAKCHDLPPPKTFTRVEDTFVTPRIARTHTTSKTRAQVVFTIVPQEYHVPRPKVSTPRSGEPVIITHPFTHQYPTWTWT